MLPDKDTHFIIIIITLTHTVCMTYYTLPYQGGVIVFVVKSEEENKLQDKHKIIRQNI